MPKPIEFKPDDFMWDDSRILDIDLTGTTLKIVWQDFRSNIFEFVFDGVSRLHITGHLTPSREGFQQPSIVGYCDVKTMQLYGSNRKSAMPMLEADFVKSSVGQCAEYDRYKWEFGLI